MKTPVHIPRFLHITSKQGAAPGTLEHVGAKKMDNVHMTLFQYNEKEVTEESITDLDSVDTENTNVSWLNIDGLHDAEVIRKVGEKFSIHSLLLEDVLNTNHRPKIEEYPDCVFIVLKMLHIDDNTVCSLEQVSLVLKKNLVLSFQEQPQDVLDPMRNRIRKGKGKIRSMGADYLLYRILDSIIDGYFVTLDQIGEQIEAVERELILASNDSVIQKIYSLRQQMLYIRKAVQPLRDVTNQLQHEETQLISDGISAYLRDLYDHTIQVIDAVDTFRDILGNMLDNYLSLMSHRMNSVMKVLTIIGSIFIPLTFIAGIYGMNFEYMPELAWQWGYFAVWGVMIVITMCMLGLMRWKKWL